MNILRGLVGTGMLAGMVLFAGISASAETITKSGKINVKARVIPAHTIVIDEQGEVVRITSNTSEEITQPRVFMVQIAAGNEKPLTDDIYKEYRRLVSPRQGKPGTLYDRSDWITQSQRQPTLLSLFQGDRPSFLLATS